MNLAPLAAALVQTNGPDAAAFQTDGPQAEAIRTVERERLAALAAADMETARRLTADDFQLISPFGDILTRSQYFDPIAAGRFRYVVWEPVTPIAVRRNGAGAIVRYQARAIVAAGGRTLPEARYWHTDYYEARDGRWQVVWSQATAVQAEP